MSAETPVKIHYFKILGYAEAIRYACALAGAPFENAFVDTLEKRNAMLESGNSAYAQFPLLEVNENGRFIFLPQTAAILRYIAQKYKLDGRGNLLVDVKINEIIEAGSDLLKETIGSMAFADEATRTTRIAETPAKAGKWLGPWEKHLAASPAGSFIAGTTYPTLADSCACRVIEEIVAYVDKSAVLGQYPKVSEWYAQFTNLPNIQKYQNGSQRVKIPITSSEIETTKNELMKAIGRA